MILQLPEVPHPDDTADALAIAICTANGEQTVERRVAAAARAGAAVLDRAAVAPDRARRDALRAGRPRGARGRVAGRTASRRARGPPADRRPPVIASVEGVVGAIAADSLVIEVGGIGYRVFTVAGGARDRARPAARSSSTPTTSSARTSRRCSGSGSPEELGFFNLLLTVTGVGPKVALAIVGSRPTRGPPARDPPAGPGGPRLDPGDRQEARRADHLRAQGEGLGGGRRGGLRGRGHDRVGGRGRGGAPGAGLLARRGARGVPAGARRTRPSARASRSASRPRSGRCSGTDA